LYDQDHFVNAGANGVHRYDVAFLVAAIGVDESSDQQLAPMQALVLPRSHHGSNYASKNHNEWSLASRQ
jgi:hypothetical protein